MENIHVNSSGSSGQEISAQQTSKLFNQLSWIDKVVSWVKRSFITVFTDKFWKILCLYKFLVSLTKNLKSIPTFIYRKFSSSEHVLLCPRSSIAVTFYSRQPPL